MARIALSESNLQQHSPLLLGRRLAKIGYYYLSGHLGGVPRPQGIKVKFELRREGGLDVIYVSPATR